MLRILKKIVSLAPGFVYTEYGRCPRQEPPAESELNQNKYVRGTHWPIHKSPPAYFHAAASHLQCVRSLRDEGLSKKALFFRAVRDAAVRLAGSRGWSAWIITPLATCFQSAFSPPYKLSTSCNNLLHLRIPLRLCLGPKTFYEKPQ
jgi:hypothetical protein